VEVNSEAMHVENKRQKQQNFALSEIVPVVLILITFQAMLMH